MSFQSDDLAVITLGVPGDARLDPEQPPLATGIHLRWAFQQSKGFPWYGYYLFRRVQPAVNPRCWGGGDGRLRPGPLNASELQTPHGRFSSPQPIVLTDSFAPSRRVELDLDRRDFLRFDPAEPARRVEVRLGFQPLPPPRTCIDFRSAPAGSGPNPRTEEGATFQVIQPPISPSFSETVVEAWPGTPRGLLSGVEIRISLPCRATRIDLLLTNRFPVEIQVFEEGKPPSQPQQLQAGALRAATVTLTGSAISQVRIGSHGADGALLHQLCFECPWGSLNVPAPPEREVELRAYAGPSRIARVFVRGRAGEVVTAALERDAISAVEIGPGPAVLVDLCWMPFALQPTQGWQPLPLQYPICLPVAHPDYPCPGKPADVSAAEELAVSRIRYGDPNELRGAEGFTELHATLATLVEGGRGTRMAERVRYEPGVPLDEGEGEVPSMPGQRPLDLVLLASLHPAAAQALGLYAVDETASPGVVYEYLLLADHDGVLGGSAASALAWIAGHPECFDPGVEAVDACRTSGKLETAPPLAAPTGVVAYSLPGATVREPDGDLRDAQASAGLRWDLRRLDEQHLQADSPVLFHLRRASLGTSEPTAPPAPGAYVLLTRGEPILVGRPLECLLPAPSPEWPPFQLHVVDSGLPEGWYGYTVTGIDLFGRYSGRSAPAEWRQWTPPPALRPWYWQDSPSDRVVHPWAVALLDKIAPPPPGIEAWALDPDDPWVETDQAYLDWREDNPGVVGLRVRWRWTLEQQDQAPDTREFRLYWQPGRWNAHLGRIVAVSAVSATETEVTTDLPNARVVDAWVATRLQVGADSFTVVGSAAGTPLRLKVRNIGPGDAVRPSAGRPCTVVIPAGHSLAVDFHRGRSWEERFCVVDYEEHFRVEPDPPEPLIRPGRLYEVFLPAPGADAGKPFHSSLADPLVYAQVGVSAADDKDHTGDDPKWNGQTWGGRPGNEGRVSAATVVRVRREKPSAPELPDGPERLLATRADYHSRSFFTFRWKPQPNLKAHVARALDESLFRLDRARRSWTLDPTDISLFPPGWNLATRKAAADELNALNDLAELTGEAYRSLSDRALRVLAGLPESAPAFTQLTIEPLDPNASANQDRRGPDDAEGYTPRSDVRVWQDTLPGRATNRYFYRALFVDAAHNRSGLSLSTPPVYLPKVEPPRAPVITGIVGGDRKITLRWASNREPDLKEYRVYRAESEERAADVRRMELVHVEPVGVGKRPVEVEWVDEPVLGLVALFYRIVATDQAGNVSSASSLRPGQAYDHGPPIEPTWERLEWILVDSSDTEHPWASATDEREPAVLLMFTTPQMKVSALGQKDVAGHWQAVTPWLRNPIFDTESRVWRFRAVDKGADPLRDQRYRAKLVSPAGTELLSTSVLLPKAD